MRRKRLTCIIASAFLTIVLITSLGISSQARSSFQKNMVDSTLTFAAEPTAGKWSYAYPDSTRTGLPGYFDSTYGINVTDGCAVWTGPDGIPFTEDDELDKGFRIPRDFSLALTYTLTEQEALAADLSKYPVLRARLGISNAQGLNADNTKYKIAIYTSDTEYFEIIKAPVNFNLDFTDYLDLSPYLSGLTDTTIQKIVVYPFYQIPDRAITEYVYQSVFLVRSFGLYLNQEEAELFGAGKLTDYAEAPVSSETPDATISVIPSISSISRNSDALNNMAQWIADNGSALNIKMAPIVGKITSLTAPAVADQHPTPYIFSDVSGTNTPAGYISYNSYIEHLLLDPTLYAAGNPAKNSLDYNQQFNNLATAMKLVSNAGIPLTLAGHHYDITVSILRHHVANDLYFRLDNTKVEKLLGNYSRTEGSGANTRVITPTVDFVRTPFFPETLTAGTDYGQYNAAETLHYSATPSGGVKNTWYKFTVGTSKYMAFTLEMHPTLAVRTWFDTLVAANPDCKVILFISGYMCPDGTLYTIWDDSGPTVAIEDYSDGTRNYVAGQAYTLSSSYLYYWLPSPAVSINGIQGDGKTRAMNYYTTGLKTNMWSSGGTDGDMFFKNHLSKYPNIVMVVDGAESTGYTMQSITNVNGSLSSRTYASYHGGKYYSEDIVTLDSEGEGGNVVHTLQLNLSEVVKEAGALMLLKFYENGSEVEVSCYIPQYNAYYKPENNVFTLDIPDPLAVNPYDAYGLSVTAAPQGGTGAITGLNPSLRYGYRVKGDSAYTLVPAGADAITNLPVGQYEVRVQSNGTYSHSDPVEYAVDTKNLEKKPFWNAFPYTSLSDTQLAALGYDVTLGDNGVSGSARTDIARNRQRTAEFFKYYGGSLLVSNLPEVPAGIWRYCGTIQSYLFTVGYGSGMYAARDPGTPNNMQFYSYTFEEDRIFEISEYPYVALLVGHHDIFSTPFASYKAALEAAGVLPKSKLLIYFYGQKEPYEYISTLSGMTTPVSERILFRVPDTIHGRVRKIEYYPIYQYWPEGLTGQINGHSYSMTEFYAGYASNIKAFGFFGSELDASYVVAAQTPPSSLTPDNAYTWYDWDISSPVEADGFTIATIPSTEKIANDSAKLQAIAQMILEQKDSLNIKMALHLGGLVDGTYSSEYWKPAEDWDNILGVGNDTTFSAYSAQLLYLMSAGAVAKADGTYDTRITSQAQNAANMIRTLLEGGLPFSTSSYITEHLGGFIRGPILSNYISSEEFGITGALRIKESSLVASNFTPGKANINQLVSAGKLVLENNPYIIDHYSYENTYYTFAFGGKEYMVVTLESYPRKTVRSWANNLIAANPDKKVIVVVSSMLDENGDFIRCYNLNDLTNPGTFSEDGGVTWKPLNDNHKLKAVYFISSATGLAVNTVIRSWNTANDDVPGDGDELYRTVIQKHANIMLVLDGGFARRTTYNGMRVLTKKMAGVNGNTVYIAQGRFDKVFPGSPTVMYVKILDNGQAVELVPFNPENEMYGYLRLEYPTYDVTVASGVVGIAPVSGVEPGTKVTLSITPQAGKKLKSGSLKIAYTHDSTYYTGLHGASVYLDTTPRTVEKILVADANGKVSFTMPHADVQIVSAEYIDIGNQNIALSAAGIRVDGTTGMRFLATFHLDGVDTTYRSLWQYGVLAIPTSLLSTENKLEFGQDGTLGALVLDIPMVNYYYYAIRPATQTGYFHYTGVITGIPEEYYKTGVSAVAYVKYTLDGETWQYAYSNVLERTYFDVAQRALLSGNETEAAEQVLANIARVRVTGVNINQSDLTLGKLVEYKIPAVATVEPSNASDARLYYTSSNTSVATVQHNYIMTKDVEGTTTISVTTADGGFVDSFVLTVSGS